MFRKLINALYLSKLELLNERCTKLVRRPRYTIQKVGVADTHLQFLIKTKASRFPVFLASIYLTVDLPKQYKGTHMSRFIEVLSIWSQKAVVNRKIKLILHM